MQCCTGSISIPYQGAVLHLTQQHSLTSLAARRRYQPGPCSCSCPCSCRAMLKGRSWLSIRGPGRATLHQSGQLHSTGAETHAGSQGVLRPIPCPDQTFPFRCCTHMHGTPCACRPVWLAGRPCFMFEVVAAAVAYLDPSPRIRIRAGRGGGGGEDRDGEGPPHLRYLGIDDCDRRTYRHRFSLFSLPAGKEGNEARPSRNAPEP